MRRKTRKDLNARGREKGRCRRSKCVRKGVEGLDNLCQQCYSEAGIRRAMRAFGLQDLDRLMDWDDYPEREMKNGKEGG